MPAIAFSDVSSTVFATYPLWNVLSRLKSMTSVLVLHGINAECLSTADADPHQRPSIEGGGGLTPNGTTSTTPRCSPRTPTPSSTSVTSRSWWTTDLTRRRSASIRSPDGPNGGEPNMSGVPADICTWRWFHHGMYHGMLGRHGGE